MLISQNGNRVDYLHCWEGGASFSKMPSQLTSFELKFNPVEVSGYLLEGKARDDSSDTLYSFTDDNMCVRMQSDGTKSEFLYSVAVNGLVTLVDAAGSGITDYLWFDVQSKDMFRYVLQKDDWFTFLNGESVPESFESAWTGG